MGTAPVPFAPLPVVPLINPDAASPIQPVPPPVLPAGLETASSCGIDPELAIESLLSDDLLEQLVVRHGPDAPQILVIQRVTWQADQQTAVIHVPLSPPLSRPPRVHGEWLEGDGRIRITDRQCFGIRVELIRGLPCSAPATMRLRLEIAAGD